jgi:hypothetical protein
MSRLNKAGILLAQTCLVLYVLSSLSWLYSAELRWKRCVVRMEVKDDSLEPDETRRQEDLAEFLCSHVEEVCAIPLQPR